MPDFFIFSGHAHTYLDFFENASFLSVSKTSAFTRGTFSKISSHEEALLHSEFDFRTLNKRKQGSKMPIRDPQRLEHML